MVILRAQVKRKLSVGLYMQDIKKSSTDILLHSFSIARGSCPNTSAQLLMLRLLL